MSAQAELMLVIAAMHILAIGFAAALIIPAIMRQPDGRRHPDAGSDGGGPPAPEPPARPSPAGGGIPLPDAELASVRLRDHRRLADAVPARERRPAREPERPPVRERQ